MHDLTGTVYARFNRLPLRTDIAVGYAAIPVEASVDGQKGLTSEAVLPFLVQWTSNRMAELAGSENYGDLVSMLAFANVVDTVSNFTNYLTDKMSIMPQEETT